MDPINVFRSRKVLRKEELGIEFGSIKGKSARSVCARKSLRKKWTWDKHIPRKMLHYYDVHTNDPAHEIAQRKDGRTLSDEQVERLWKGMLGRT